MLARLDILIRLIKNYWAAIFFLVIAFMVDMDFQKWKTPDVLHYDTYGYHNYAPALIIYKDITKYSFLDSIEPKYKPTGETFFKYGLFPNPNNDNLVNQYTVGVAIVQSPLFLIAHLYASLHPDEVADGYSSPYQHAVVISTLIFSFLGLIFLTKFLKPYFHTNVVNMVIISIAFGTNFFEYATLSSGFSHNYSFCLYALMLLISDKMYHNPKPKYFIYIGIMIGLATLIRLIDGLIVLIPIIWFLNLNDKKVFLQKFKWFIIISSIITFSIISIQLFYWKYTTGQWLYFSYRGDYFQFKEFKVFHGLFSYRRGFFVYAPIVLFGCLGFLFIKKKSHFHFYKKHIWIFLIPMIYIIFSWKNWIYGWGYGSRPMIQLLTLFAVPMAFLFQHLINKGKFYAEMLIVVILFFVYMNQFQINQYRYNILNGVTNNMDIYWKIWLKPNHPEGIEELIKKQDDIDFSKGDKF